jgi:hypothetical protein
MQYMLLPDEHHFDGGSVRPARRSRRPARRWRRTHTRCEHSPSAGRTPLAQRPPCNGALRYAVAPAVAPFAPASVSGVSTFAFFCAVRRRLSYALVNLRTISG